MLMCVKEGKRTRPTPTPPPDPPEGGKGGGCLHSIKLHAADSAPRAKSTTFSRKFGVRAGDTERNTQCFKGTL
jgi:hypothetical protein